MARGADADEYVGEVIAPSEDDRMHTTLDETTGPRQVAAVEAIRSPREEINAKMKETIEEMIKRSQAPEGKKAELAHILEKYAEVFETTLSNPGTALHIPHRINTGDHNPVYTPPYRKSDFEHKIVDE